MTNRGVIHNAGKIESKGTVESSTGQIVNDSGRVHLKASAIIGQDTIGGHVYYESDDETQNQIVAQIAYRNLIFAGRGLKQITSDDSITAIDTLLTTSSDVDLRLGQQTTIFANGRVTHNGRINRVFNYGRLALNGEEAQAIDGLGNFNILALDNSQGADVVNGGGFAVDRRLELIRGEFRNSFDNNFSIGDSALILRNVDASIAFAPLFSENVSVTYLGEGGIVAGEELPSDESILQDLRVENTAGLELAKSITVNDSLFLASDVNTDPGDEEHVLTHASIDNPEFANEDIEIRGSVRRSRLVTGGERNVFNNEHTFVQFENDADMGDVAAMTVRVLPDTVPLPNNLDNSNKVRRSISVVAEDDGGLAVNDGFIAGFGYGWKLDDRDETNGLDTFDVQLQRYENGEWENVAEPKESIQKTGNWAHSFVPALVRSGFYAIGVGDEIPAALVNISVMLEGPYRNGSMLADLWEGGFVPNRPPDIFPYTLDPDHDRIVLRDDFETEAPIVDWVLVEFRNQISGGQSKYRTGLVLTSGKIVNYVDGSPIKIDSGNYYIVIRHRNHLAVITKDEQFLTPTLHSFDFTRAELLFGGSNAAKLVDDAFSGRRYFALIAGDANGDGFVNELDYNASNEATWQQHDAEGYVNSDTDMNGIVTTRDANYSWNNRDRESLVK